MDTKKSKKKISFKDVLKQIGKKILKFFNKYGLLIIMNAIIFSLTIFIESIYFYHIGLWWVLNTILFIVVPTVIFCIWGKIDSLDVIVSVPVLYILFLIFLNFCTMRDLYGITSGNLDSIPNYIDALFVTFIFTFIEYITAYIVKVIKNHKKK